VSVPHRSVQPDALPIAVPVSELPRDSLIERARRAERAAEALRYLADNLDGGPDVGTGLKAGWVTQEEHVRAVQRAAHRAAGGLLAIEQVLEEALLYEQLENAVKS
jgi:hypothetical protein